MRRSRIPIQYLRAETEGARLDVQEIDRMVRGNFNDPLWSAYIEAKRRFERFSAELKRREAALPLLSILDALPEYTEKGGPLLLVGFHRGGHPVFLPRIPRFEHAINAPHTFPAEPWQSEIVIPIFAPIEFLHKPEVSPTDLIRPKERRIKLKEWWAEIPGLWDAIGRPVKLYAWCGYDPDLRGWWADPTFGDRMREIHHPRPYTTKPPEPRGARRKKASNG
jgi:hypothetical protein